MRTPKIYIAGKITGLDLNEARKAFADAEAFLREVAPKCAIVNPMTLPHQHDHSYESYMQECLEELKQCQVVYVLNGWSGSKGVLTEIRMAAERRMLIIFETANADKVVAFELNKMIR